MALINIDLLDQGTTVIDSSNWDSADTLQLSLVSSGTLVVDGVDVNLTSIVGGGLLSNTTIQAINGANVVVDSGLAGVQAGSSFTYSIGANSSIEVQASTLNLGLLNGVTVDFASSGGTGLFTYDSGLINLNLSTPPNVINVGAGDRIEVVGSNYVGQIGNVVTFYSDPLHLLPVGSYSIPDGVTYNYDGGADTLTFTSCFLRGTYIRTPEGEVPVEELRVGDLVVTYNGEGVSEIKWVGRRMLDPKALDKPRDTMPIRIKAGAIAENVPERDLLVSPDHCMFFEDSLIPAKFLVNGTTITQDTMLTPFEYFHIELERHNIILAEGALTETYLDLGGRVAFLEPGVLRFGALTATRSWNDWCYPPVYAGGVLEKVRHSLTQRAAELGYIVEEAKAS
ncbi:Hint domain-containing protein [Rhizobium sp. YS-1r]|uniref:Hint domain-containing protein n=1 Tax=Rhizobium sp. YS-1r TaxID=1532558 RepID=UPI0005107A81|nr:Hint domain-containing protein [Rhizobium sp. YS-1r]KGD99373.1 hypothetical protein JL39_13645 [Rhizobium sp. YS-1r]